LNQSTIVTLIENPNAFNIHNNIIQNLKARLEKGGWTVANLDETEQKGKYPGQYVPDLIALTPENILVFIEYKKKTYHESLQFYEYKRFKAYRDWVNNTGIPLILALGLEQSELLLP
jgi:hypothetical protein